MGNVVCQVNCFYNRGGFCSQEYTMLNGMGMCEELWDKNGARKPRMRDTTVENKEDYLKRMSEKIGDKDEKDENKEEKSDLNAEIDKESLNKNTENGGEPKDDTE